MFMALDLNHFWMNQTFWWEGVLLLSTQKDPCKAVKPGGDVNENGRCVSLRTTNPFTLWRRTYARNHVVPVRQHNQQRAVPLSKNNTNHSPNYLIETNIFKFLLEHLFWFTWQRSRLSWTCGCYTHPDRTSNELVWKIVESIIWDWNVSSVVLICGSKGF